MMEERIKALGMFLGICEDCDIDDCEECDRIDQSSHSENEFEFEGRMTTSGTSPAGCVSKVRNLRKVLKEFYPESDNWTSDQLKRFESLYQDLKPAAVRFKTNLEDIAKNMPMVSVKMVNLPFMKATDMVTLTAELWDGKSVKASVGASGIEKQCNLVNSERDSKFKFENEVVKLRLATADYERVRLNLLDIPCYANIEPKIKSTFDWSGPHDNGRAHAYQELVNCLYHIISYGEENYQLMDRQAFDGEVVKDLRKPFHTSDGEYLVVDEDEAEELWDQSLQNYLDGCILPELPETARKYFDEEKWKDAARRDGRGHSLSSYDGNENFQDDFCIYRIN